MAWSWQQATYKATRWCRRGTPFSPKYAQTIFYTQRETASERSENRLKAIYIAPRVDASRADTRYDISFTDFDLSIPASDFYTVTLGASQYLYWLTKAQKEKESDPNIWRVCGVYYLPLSACVHNSSRIMPSLEWLVVKQIY